MLYVALLSLSTGVDVSFSCVVSLPTEKCTVLFAAEVSSETVVESFRSGGLSIYQSSRPLPFDIFSDAEFLPITRKRPVALVFRSTDVSTAGAPCGDSLLLLLVDRSITAVDEVGCSSTKATSPDFETWNRLVENFRISFLARPQRSQASSLVALATPRSSSRLSMRHQ
uniref:Secreted protein n=1 Tax=Parascaris univalens TaxID=6257 RepID=A0A915ATQ4_PARUN